MKIDEAISLLKQYIDYNNPNIPDFYTMEEACEVAIEALEQEPCDIQKLKVGDTVLVKCKVEAVFTGSQMVMVTTRDCDQGFDAYIDEIVCVCQDNIKQIKQEHCGDCINRQAVLDIVEREPFKGDALSEIEKLPSVTPKPKMGKWLYNKEEDSYRCSLCTFPCHKDNLGAIPTEYCAGCGAVMEVWNDKR